MKKQLLIRALMIQALIGIAFANVGYSRDWPDLNFAVTVEGKVTDDTGSPLPGVNIVEKGTSSGAVTDAAGYFKLEVKDANSILVFSFIGFATKEIQVGTQSAINVSMEPDVVALSEIVVTGYGKKIFVGGGCWKRSGKRYRN